MSGNWDRAAFRAAYVAEGGTEGSARSYVTYLLRVERVLGNLDAEGTLSAGQALIDRGASLDIGSWGGAKERRDSLSALRKFVDLRERHDLHELPVSEGT